MEALVGGACVFSDSMLGVPAGLENGTSVVFFTSATDLKNKILYYMSHPEERINIAKAGRSVAMRRHRSWHRMEEIIFGHPSSVCEPDQPLTECNPWVVHFNETCGNSAQA